VAPPRRSTWAVAGAVAIPSRREGWSVCGGPYPDCGKLFASSQGNDATAFQPPVFSTTRPQLQTDCKRPACNEPSGGVT
jgi:hypothetical protein